MDPHDNDEMLLAEWRGGDSRAGDRLIRRHFPAVFRFFRTKVPVAVDDLVQRTFLACVESRESYRGEGRFRAYLLGIARVQLLRFLQRELPRIPDPLEQTSLSLAEQTGSPSQLVVAREEQDVLLEALRRIPLNLQMTIELHYWEDLGVQEIALVMDVPAGTVKTRLRRARIALRDAIAQVDAPAALRAAALDGVAVWVKSLRELVGEEPELPDDPDE